MPDSKNISNKESTVSPVDNTNDIVIGKITNDSNNNSLSASEDTSVTVTENNNNDNSSDYTISLLINLENRINEKSNEIDLLKSQINELQLIIDKKRYDSDNDEMFLTLSDRINILEKYHHQNFDNRSIVESESELLIESWKMSSNATRLSYVKTLTQNRLDDDLSLIIDKAINMDTLISNREKMINYINNVTGLFARSIFSLETSALNYSDIPAKLFSSLLNNVVLSANTAFTNAGINIIRPETGKLFKHEHKIVDKVDSDLPENVVIQVICYGVVFNGKVLLPAEVIVSSGIQPNINKVTEDVPDIEQPIVCINTVEKKDSNEQVDKYLDAAPSCVRILHQSSFDFVDNENSKDDISVILSIVRLAIDENNENYNLTNLLENFVKFYDYDSTSDSNEWHKLIFESINELETWLIKKINIEKINPQPNEKFDELRMIAVDKSKTRNENAVNTVIATYRPGYLKNDDVIIKAEVKIYE